MITLRPEIADRIKAGDISSVRASLQLAIELEHATIPPYLYALYSLAPGTNTAVAGIIESVVTEEMLHLTLAANMLNAIGGSPVLDSPAFIPRYPGPLPGSVEGQLVVGLAPCSLDQVKNTFMAIEQPEHPLDFQVTALPAGASLTIGQFYRAIRAALVQLGEKAFSGDPRDQISPDQMPRAVIVTDVASACRAVDIITDQGEGTSKSPLEIVGSDYAHYYRFAEIARGRRLVRNPDAPPGAPPDQQYSYTGEPVTFDPASVLAVPANPSTTAYPAGSSVLRACVNFNYTYTNLLKCLHATLSGKPGEFPATIGLMMSLKQQALDMMTGVSTDSVPAGPTFEWQPVNTC